ncbi:MAG: hypothetical protein QXQ68_05930 [Candidatus Nitrosocaldaceae archaeon]
MKEDMKKKKRRDDSSMVGRLYNYDIVKAKMDYINKARADTDTRIEKWTRKMKDPDTLLKGFISVYKLYGREAALRWLYSCANMNTEKAKIKRWPELAMRRYFETMSK